MLETIEIQNDFITNKPINGPHPKGQPWEYYLFAEKVSGKKRLRYVHTLTAPTRKAADRLLAELIDRPDVKLIGA